MRIGIDLGGTNIAGGVVSPNGELLFKKSIPTKPCRGVDAVIADITALCRSLAKECGENNVQSIGIGCPGMVHPPDGTITNAANIGFVDIPIADIMGGQLHLPVYVENDSNCAALAESMFGAARGSKVSVTVTLGTGIGSGIVIGGKIFSGAFFGAGEVGHHIIHVNGEPCGCGRRGCWETYASATALTRQSGGMSPKEAFDTAPKHIVEKYLDNLCIGLANIIAFLQPDVIVIGGGISGQGQSLITAIESRMDVLVIGGKLKTRFAVSQLGNDAGIIGAACIGT